MKKFLVMVVAAIMASMSVSAQTAGNLYYRAQIGPNLSKLTGSDDFKYKVGYTADVGIDYCLTNQFAIGFDINNNYIGTKSKALNDEDISLHYFGFGPLAKLYATPWMALYAGPEINFLTSAKIADTSNMSKFKKTELAVPLGISFEPVISKRSNIAITIDLRYRLGLSKVNKSDPFWDKDVKNSTFILTIGYKSPF